VGGRGAEAGKYFPFCSERCQKVDLGHWFNDEYVIPGNSQEEAGEDEAAGEQT